MLDIMAGMEQKNSYVLLFASWLVWTRRISSGSSPYSSLCLVRQRIHAVRQFTEYFLLYAYWWIMDPQVDSRPALFQRLLGSTVDTSTCVSLRGCLPGHDAPRAGFLRCPQAPDARHHGRNGPEGQFSAGFLVAFPQVQLMNEVVVPVV